MLRECVLVLIFYSMKYIGVNSTSKIRKHFSVQKMFVETMRVYDELLEKSSHG